MLTITPPMGHISALMERLKTVSKGYEQHKTQHNDLMTMPESGYNTRMNEDQQLCTKKLAA
jgi:hypothetical protein